MTSTRRAQPGFKSLCLSTWPLWTLLVFASLAAVHLLPGGYGRAVIAAPILLMAPGSLTLGAVFNQRRPQGVVFVCYATLLSVVWIAFASLVLYVGGVLITAASTYWCLLAVSTFLAIVAEARLLLDRPGKGRRAARKLDLTNPDQYEDEAEAEADDAGTPAVAVGAGYYSIVAVVAGVSFLAGGLYAYDHSPHPAPAGYTWIAWTGPSNQKDIVISSTGKRLYFQIVHHESYTTRFKLTAAWLGSTSQPLAKPLTFNVGPDQTFQGSLFVPPLPDGCTYRIVVGLTAAQQIDPLTKKPQTWSINADVHDPSKSSKMCKRLWSSSQRPFDGFLATSNVPGRTA